MPLPPNTPTTTSSSSEPPDPQAPTPPSPSDATSSQSMRVLCAKLHSRVSHFLSLPTVESDPASPALRSAQAHTRASIAVIEEALQKYP